MADPGFADDQIVRGAEHPVFGQSGNLVNVWTWAKGSICNSAKRATCLLSAEKYLCGVDMSLCSLADHISAP
jgi:hypothetical protein